jgi:hypothetical protein
MDLSILKLSIAELKEICRENDIKGFTTKKKKEQLIDHMKNHYSIIFANEKFLDRLKKKAEDAEEKRAERKEKHKAVVKAKEEMMTWFSKLKVGSYVNTIWRVPSTSTWMGGDGEINFHEQYECYAGLVEEIRENNDLYLSFNRSNKKMYLLFKYDGSKTSKIQRWRTEYNSRLLYVRVPKKIWEILGQEVTHEATEHYYYYPETD